MKVSRIGEETDNKTVSHGEQWKTTTCQSTRTGRGKQVGKTMPRTGYIVGHLKAIKKYFFNGVHFEPFKFEPWDRDKQMYYGVMWYLGLSTSYPMINRCQIDIYIGVKK